MDKSIKLVKNLSLPQPSLSRAGGCVQNTGTFLLNPQYRFDVSGSAKDIVFVSLMQPDTRPRKTKGSVMLCIGTLQ